MVHTTGMVTKQVEGAAYLWAMFYSRMCGLNYFVD